MKRKGNADSVNPISYTYKPIKKKQEKRQTRTYHNSQSIQNLIHPQRPSGDVRPDFFIRPAGVPAAPGAPVSCDIAQVGLAAAVGWWLGSVGHEVGKGLGGCDARGPEGAGDVVPAFFAFRLSKGRQGRGKKLTIQSFPNRISISPSCRIVRGPCCPCGGMSRRRGR